MKIFIFCVMTMLDDSQITYQYKESFTSKFACLDQARKEAEESKKQDTSNMKDVEYFCGTSEQFVGKYV